MKVTLDTQSNGFRSFRRWIICIFIWVVVIIISRVVEERTGWDTDFFEGYFSAVMVAYASSRRSLAE